MNTDGMTYPPPSTPTAKLVRVQEKGQVTIPIQTLKKYGIKKGDFVAVVETEQGVLFSPREVVAVDAMKKIGEALRANGVTVENWIETSRDIRGKIIEEKYGLTETK
jgi:bifunctional DNA-binding transcriptional regulator/antitoxin component of YhaV-PrlF toxin-antitoxin module